MTPFDARLAMLADQAKVRPSHVHHLLAAIREPGFTPESFATFARLEQVHVDRMMAALQSSGLMPVKRRRTTGTLCSDKNPSRLPPALQLPDDWLAYAQTKRRWDKATTEDVLADFIEHWSNRTDARAAKIDWTLTWQTWVRRDRRPDGTWTFAKPNIADRIELCRNQIALYRRMGRETEIPEIERVIARLEARLTA